jgi:LmbE family N-acetylglucosaminyl deacetylase
MTAAVGTSSQLPRVRSVLAVCAHPDDESFGLGGALSAFSDSGSVTAVMCFTRGESSTLGEELSLLGHVRSGELSKAAAELGVGYVELLDYPDGALAEQRLDVLALQVFEVADRVDADLLLVFDEGGVTGHPDHQHATKSALACAEHSALPVLAWSLDEAVASVLNRTLGTAFVGRSREQLDFDVHVDRARQGRAIACHASQSRDNPVLWQRLRLQGDREVLRWLRGPTSS